MKRYLLAVVGIAVLAAATVFLVAACGGDTTSPASSEPAAAATGAAALLPAAIKDSGVLRFGTNAESPPAAMFDTDNETIIGSDVEIGTALAEKLGLKAEWTSINWDGLRPSLLSGRFDAVMSQMGDFTDRQAQVTFVDYMKGGICLLIRAEDEGKYQKIEDLAGVPLGATKGASTVGVGKQAIKQLESEGLEPATLALFPGEGPGSVALRSGRIDGYVYDWMGGVYRKQTQPDFSYAFPDMLGASYPYGIALPKTDDGQKMAEAMSAALDELIADGTYQKILDKYGMGDFAVEKAVINGGTTSSGA